MEYDVTRSYSTNYPVNCNTNQDQGLSSTTIAVIVIIIVVFIIALISAVIIIWLMWVNWDDNYCSIDSDCPSGYVCSGGICVQDQTSNPCPAGQVRRGGRCVDRACTADFQCPRGTICKNGACVESECDANRPCPEGTVCRRGRCVVIDTSARRTTGQPSGCVPCGTTVDEPVDQCPPSTTVDEPVYQCPPSTNMNPRVTVDRVSLNDPNCVDMRIGTEPELAYVGGIQDIEEVETENYDYRDDVRRDYQYPPQPTEEPAYRYPEREWGLMNESYEQRNNYNVFPSRHNLYRDSGADTTNLIDTGRHDTTMDECTSYDEDGISRSFKQLDYREPTEYSQYTSRPDNCDDRSSDIECGELSADRTCNDPYTEYSCSSGGLELYSDCTNDNSTGSDSCQDSASQYDYRPDVNTEYCRDSEESCNNVCESSGSQSCNSLLSSTEYSDSCSDTCDEHSNPRCCGESEDDMTQPRISWNPVVDCDDCTIRALRPHQSDDQSCEVDEVNSCDTINPVNSFFINSGLLYVLDDGRIYSPVTQRVVSSLNRIPTYLTGFKSLIVAIRDGRLLARINNGSGDLLPYLSIDGVEFISSTHDGRHLWIQRSNGMGYLYNSQLAVINQVVMNPGTVVKYGRDVTIYGTLDTITHTLTMSDGTVYPNVKDFVIAPDDSVKILTISEVLTMKSNYLSCDRSCGETDDVRLILALNEDGEYVGLRVPLPPPNFGCH